MTRLGRSFDSQWTQTSPRPNRPRHTEPSKAPEKRSEERSRPRWRPAPEHFAAEYRILQRFYIIRPI